MRLPYIRDGRLLKKMKPLWEMVPLFSSRKLYFRVELMNAFNQQCATTFI